MSQIRDLSLQDSGKLKIQWVRSHMPLLRGLQEEFSVTQPFKGKKIALSVHLEAKTAYLCEVLASGGAQMFVTGSNPLSTQDDIAAALASEGMEVSSDASFAKIKAGQGIVIGSPLFLGE